MCAHQAASYGATVTTHDRTTNEGNAGASAAGHTPIAQYEIRVRGHLGSRWSAWFEGLSLTSEDDGTTVIRGPLVDQAALHGVLQKLRNVGIPLLSLTELSLDAATEPPGLANDEGN